MPKPKRIQRQRTKGWRTPPNCVYVGRPTRYGNPYKVQKMFGQWWRVVRMIGGGESIQSGAMTKSEATELAVDLYRVYVEKQLQEDPFWLKPIQGKDLACWCPLDQPCHVDILLKLAN